jgi:hypothetical protein
MLKPTLETIKIACVFALIFYSIFVVLEFVQPEPVDSSEVNY